MTITILPRLFSAIFLLCCYLPVAILVVTWITERIEKRWNPLVAILSLGPQIFVLFVVTTFFVVRLFS